ncbi:hypothetical protein J0X14_14320 [Muricauda sp. CAU 1633]|uniref:hypothetical protein n=1 Tax=Allomuricauda sp. CAU 1633 TaxID=2816036 RepID=UPI001A8FFCD5|nr:hypothetical protein [Muricauda sp. CAU 1633]MBO0323480.1 hypothetical protein [Muricauda sp. CAU 1633]
MDFDKDFYVCRAISACKEQCMPCKREEERVIDGLEKVSNKNAELRKSFKTDAISMSAQVTTKPYLNNGSK